MNNRGIQPGEKHARLTAVRFVGRNKRGLAIWLFHCDCGNDHEAVSAQVRNGNTKSCGCFNIDRIKERRTTHGHTVGGKPPEYNTWLKIKDRCSNPKASDYARYGGRGIRVCQRWIDSFEDFLSDVGYRPSAKHSIDRFPNNNGDYEPGNVRWALGKEQARNKRNNRLVNFGGRMMSLAEACDIGGFKYGRVIQRLTSGWPEEKALAP